jgi:hypothetical protein
LVVGVSIPALPVDAQVERLCLPGGGSRAALCLAAVRAADETSVHVAVQVGSGLPVRVMAVDAGQVGEAIDSSPYLRQAATELARRMLVRMGAAA